MLLLSYFLFHVVFHEEDTRPQAKLHALFFPVFLGSFCKWADTPVEVVFLVYYPGSSILNLRRGSGLSWKSCVFKSCLLSVLHHQAADKTVTVGRPVSPGRPSSPETATDFGWGEILLLRMVSSENLRLFPLGLWYFSDLSGCSSQPSLMTGSPCHCVSYFILPSPPFVPHKYPFKF